MVGGLRRLRVRRGRWLDDQFLFDLKEGVLEPLTEAVLSDTSLCLELRGTNISVYYRGGRLMNVQERSGGYDVCFDTNYFAEGEKVPLPDRMVSDKAGISKWIEVAPCLKQAMDRHFRRKQPKLEREFQQILLRDNNVGRKADGKQSVARSTDYFVCDIEYSSDLGRFDLIAVHWPSDQRKETRNRRLVVIEMKYGDGAIARKTAGLHAHVNDVNKYLRDTDNVKRLKEEMVRVFNQKRSLGLIDCGKDLCGLGDERPMLLLVLANHNPNSTSLRDTLCPPPDSPHVDLHIATASFLGYGLYDQGIHTVRETFERFGEYIHKDLDLVPNACGRTQSAAES